ncbi:hypothetical protein GCM10022251_22240 [Phytohabitans flavus]|uniref:EthD domain-containing protein n=1 Tax=Phytohabitans flavus TaxID=1076124 RepID=A0A6F8XS70_9ACTN|nr:hypothetical protein [Phytohabitans flavus]BCB76598.1 hypothetical protein Pflav_030080 [Phytohabitans flavus]
MSRALRLVFSTPPDGVEDAEYHAWYEEHVHDVLLVPGYRAARRFRVDAYRLGWPPTGHRFLTVYEQGPRPADIRRHLAALGRGHEPEWFGRLDFASWDCVLKPGYDPPTLTGEMFLALSSPPEGVEAAAYDDYYRGHLLENVAVEGIDSGCRYAVTPVGGNAPREDPLTHLALYQLTEPMSRVRPRLGQMVLPPWFGAIRFASVEAVALGPRVTRAGDGGQAAQPMEETPR